MNPAKNLGGEGSKENLRGGALNFMKFYSRFVKISRVGIFGQIFPFLAKKKF